MARNRDQGLSLKPDDLLFVAMLAAWVVLVDIVTYLLLGWASAAALIIVAGLFGIGTVAIQSRLPRHRTACKPSRTRVAPDESHARGRHRAARVRSPAL